MSPSSSSNDQHIQMNGTSVNRHPKLRRVTTSGHHRTIAKWLGKKLRVYLKDGRVITGILVCADNEPNFILTNAEESWEENGYTRQQGSVLICMRYVRRIVEIGLLNSIP